MSDQNIAMIVLALLGLAAVLSLWFWLWAWIAGPAVRHLGKCFAQGWAQGLRDVEGYTGTGPLATLEKVGLMPPRVPEQPQDVAPVKDTNTAPAVRDAGHRWLGKG